MNKKTAAGGGFLAALLAALLAYFGHGTPNPKPTPSPSEFPSPSPTIAPTPNPTPTVAPTPTPTTNPNSCPATCPQNAKTINSRCMDFNPQTGKCRTDASPRCGDIGNDEGYCGVVTGNPSIHSCKASPEGSGLDIPCNLAFNGTKCQAWFYSVNGGKNWTRCLPDGIGPDGQPFSCDHFDDYIEWQGPYTGYCETGGNNIPITGYHMIPHGLGLIRACDISQTVCSEPISVNY